MKSTKIILLMLLSAVLITPINLYAQFSFGDSFNKSRNRTSERNINAIKAEYEQLRYEYNNLLTAYRNLQNNYTILETKYRHLLNQKRKKNEVKQTEENIASQQKTFDIIESQIDGDFEGWEGETIVKLMNGQIWKQTEYYYYYHYAYMPKVLIYKSSSGYKMKVEGIEKAIGVIRLK